MKDFLDKEIKVGDMIVACVSHGRNSGASLTKFRVTGLTNSFVLGNIPDYNGRLSEYPKFNQTRISPSKCIIIPE